MTILLFLLLQDPLDPFPKVRVPVPVLKPAQTVPLNTVKAGPVQEIPAKPKDEPKIAPKEEVRDYMMRPESGEVEGQRHSFLIRAEPGCTIWQTSYQWEASDPQHKQELEGEPGAIWLKLPWTVPDSGEITLFTPPSWKPDLNLSRIHTHWAVEYPDTGGWSMRRVTFNRGQRNVAVDLRREK